MEGYEWMLWYFCTLCVFQIAISSYAQWENYEKTIGPTLTNTFQHPNTLREALRHHLRETKSLHNAMVYECHLYREGEGEARRQREGMIPHRNATLVPFLVDQERDQMCFLRISKPNMRDESKHSIMFSPNNYRLPILRPLKIDSSLYHSLNSPALILSPDITLAISFRQEGFGTEPYIYCMECFNSMKQQIVHTDSLPYSELYSNFFWTSSIAHGYFQRHHEGDNQEEFFDDYSRYKKILQILQPLSNEMNSDNYQYAYYEPYSSYESMNTQRLEYESYEEKSLRGPEKREKDITYPDRICDFSSLVDSNSIGYSPGMIRIPVDKIAQNKGSDIQHACVFLLAMAMTTMNCTHHIALESSPQLLNYRARSIPQSSTVGNQLANQPYTAAGLLGDGQIIGIADTGVDVNSCYFYDSAGRVTPSLPNAPIFNQGMRKIVGYIYNSCGDQTDTSGGHGTHVAGTVAGSIPKSDITSGGQYAGVAPNAKVIFNDFSRGGSGLCIPGAQQLYGIGYSGGARIHTNSWGSPFTGTGYYSTAETDNYLRNNPGITVFFAGGNSGGNGMGTSTLTMESSAKNVIGVASGQTTLGSANISYIAWYSSKGPPYDGRFKPDIVAPGDGLLSAMASGTTNNSQTCNTIEMTGTSMASPAAAGNAALVRQYFIDTTGRFWTGICKAVYRSCRAFTPTGYLVKALIIHSGIQMTLFNGGGEYDIQLKKPPDFIQGFGRIGLHTVLPLKGKITSFDLFVADAVNVAENSMVGYFIEISNASKPLGITITWYDPPNIQGTTTKALINDINLLATSPTGQKFFPNGRTFADSNNNVEKIVIPSAASGKWKVTVSANALPVTGNQLFAIVITSSGTVTYG